jgi:hypothetical protein
MQLWEGLIQAGWANNQDDGFRLLTQCLIDLNGIPMELENYDKSVSPKDELCLYESNPNRFNAFAVIMTDKFKIK